MKKYFSIYILISICLNVHAQSLSDLSFGTDSTFEVLTWNIEWFPKNGQSTADSVKQIIKDNPELFEELEAKIKEALGAKGVVIPMLQD